MTRHSVFHSDSSVTVRSVIDDYAEKSPESIFVVDLSSEQVLRYIDLQQRIQCIARRIAAYAQPGQSVAYALGNCGNAAEAVLALFYGGFLATAINMVAGQSAIRFAIGHSEAAVVVVDDEHAASIQQIISTLEKPPRLLRLDTLLLDSDADADAVSTASLPPPPLPQTPALLMYTSGTTGTPKGVVLSHRAVLAGGENTATAHQLTAQDRALCTLPLYHINGLCVTIMAPLVSGGSVVVASKFSTRQFWHWTEKFDCSWVSLVPTVISYLIQAERDQPTSYKLPTHMRFARSASAPLSPEIHRQFESIFGLPMIETMGLTETAAQILSNPLPPGIQKIGSPGIAFGNKVMIADGEGRAVAAGEEGEIWVRGDNVMLEYYKNPQATAKALTPEGWLRTGDLAHMDNEGYVFVTGRLKELIIKGGENIAPREIDDVLYQHSDVVEAAAIAVPCSRYGQQVQACVVLSAGSKTTAEDLINLCQKHIGAFKAPNHIHFLANLPKGPSGKILRKQLVDQFSGVQTKW